LFAEQFFLPAIALADRDFPGSVSRSAETDLPSSASAAVAHLDGQSFASWGEDQAITDGFAEVLRQTAETTKTTKAIEARISNDVWDRQKLWEMKREVLFVMAKRVAEWMTPSEGSIRRFKGNTNQTMRPGSNQPKNLQRNEEKPRPDLMKQVCW
jgi:hypothetical protein